MKIERINENQIRCTLSSFDLSVRDLNLGELAYGSEKAKKLFREMIQKASNEVGFEAEDIPLMVEAIPLSNESIMLIITKIEDPEELDTRFSKFSPSGEEDSRESSTPQFTGADDILDIFQKLVDSKLKAHVSSKKQQAQSEETAAQVSVSLIQIFRFSSLDSAICAAQGLNNSFQGENSLYKDPSKGTYHLVLHQSGYSPEEFNRICNVLSEYGTGKTYTAASEAYLKEHGEVLIREQALQMLSQL